MSVAVRLPAVLRVHAGGEAKVESSGATVGDIINDLVERFPGMKSNILTDDGALHRFINVFVNDEDVRYMDKLDTAVADGDEVTLMPAVAGGAV